MSGVNGGLRPAAVLHLFDGVVAPAGPSTRTYRDPARWILAVVAVLTTWVGVQFAADGQPNFWFGRSYFGVPLAYLCLGGIIALSLPFLRRFPRVSVAAAVKSLGLWRWAVVGWVVLMFALARALWDGVENIFADWRDLAVLAIVAVLVARIIAHQPWRREFVLDLAILYGFAAWIPLAVWLAGGGVILFGVRTPIFNSPPLYMSAFAALVLIEHWSVGLRRFPRGRQLAILIAATGSVMLVLLAFRRGFWLILGLGVVAILFLRMRDRSQNKTRLVVTVALAGALVVGGYVAFGAETFTDRLASFLPGSQSSFSATNTDHINDIIDAYHAGRDNILLGLGMGHYYETTLITRWKTESFEVHNAVVQAWLKFGLLGAIAYVAFHFRWALAALRAPVSDDAERHSLVAVGIYIGAEFVSMLSATWPYNSFQQAVHHGLLLGAVLAVAAPRLGSSPPVPEPIRAGV